MRLLNGALLAVSLASLVVAAPADDAPPFGFPSGPPAVQPAPGGVLSLTGDSLLVVQFKVDHVLRPHPFTLVKYTKETGPLRIRARFADGSGKVETRTYLGPCVWIVEAAGKGRVEIDAIPKDWKTEADIVMTTVDVDSGQAPQPPPKIDPVVPPDPKPALVTSFRVLYVYDTMATYTPAQTGVLYSKLVADYLDAKTTKDGVTAGWRRFGHKVDVSNEFPTMKALWAAVKPQLSVIPCIVIETNGKADILPFPGTQEEMLTTLKKYGEGR